MLITIYDETPYVFDNMYMDDFHCISTTKESDDMFTKCTKAELYELVFGITDIDGLPDIDYYRGRYGHIPPNTNICIMSGNHQKCFHESFCIHVCSEIKEINDKLKHRNLYFIVNEERIDLNESMIDEEIRKRLLKNGTRFYITKNVKYDYERTYYWVSTRVINPICINYLIQKFFRNEVLKQIIKENNLNC